MSLASASWRGCGAQGVLYWSPGLALVLSTALLLSADAFWLQQILKLSDVHLSCSFVVWITYATYPTILLSSVFRAARVVVMTDEKFRAKFAYVLGTRFQACLIGACTLVMMCAPASLQPTHHAHDPQYCMSFEPFELWLSVLIVIAWLYGYMIYSHEYTPAAGHIDNLAALPLSLDG
eukprot:12248-Heterococcus_DN1.PRE.11